MRSHSVLPLGGLFSCQATDYYLLTIKRPSVVYFYHDKRKEGGYEGTAFYRGTAEKHEKR